jgi:hypothetical protein
MIWIEVRQRSLTFVDDKPLSSCRVFMLQNEHKNPIQTFTENILLETGILTGCNACLLPPPR